MGPHRASAAIILALVVMPLMMLSGSSAAIAQAPPAQNNAGATAEPAQSEPMQGRNPNPTAGQRDATITGPALPHQPAPAANSPGTGGYWYWIAAIIIVAAGIWGAPRFLRRVKGSRPRR